MNPLHSDDSSPHPGRAHPQATEHDESFWRGYRARIAEECVETKEPQHPTLWRYLNTAHTPDWSKHDLIQEGYLFASALKKQFPELDEISVRALTSRFTYDWR